MPLTDAQKRANAKYNKANWTYQTIKYRNTDALTDRVRLAVSLGKGKSVNDYMIQAIKEKLEKDQIPLPD